MVVAQRASDVKQAVVTSGDYTQNQDC